MLEWLQLHFMDLMILVLIICGLIAFYKNT
jgi:hypothetical protein